MTPTHDSVTYYRPARVDGKRAATKRSYAQALDYYILPELGDIPLGELQKPTLTAFLNKLASKYSKTVVQQCRYHIRAIFDEAVEAEWIYKNPARKLPMPDCKEPDQPYMENEEFVKWRGICPNPAPDAFIFPNTEGNPMDPSNFIDRLIRPAAERAKISVPATFQVMRRTTATKQQAHGGIKSVRGQLRHSTVQTTESDSYENWKQLSATLNLRTDMPPLLLQSPDEEEYFGNVELWLRLKRRGLPVEWFLYPNEGHVKRSPADRWWLYKRNLDWFRFWLQDDEDPNPANRAQYARWNEMKRHSGAPTDGENQQEVR